MPKLFLHDAIAIVLLANENRISSTDEIAAEINRRNLYQRKDGTAVPAYQIKQRTKLSSGQYHHLFEWIELDMVKLRNLE